MRKKIYGLMVFMLALTSIAGCGKSKEAEETIAWVTTAGGDEPTEKAGESGDTKDGADEAGEVSEDGGIQSEAAGKGQTGAESTNASAGANGSADPAGGQQGTAGSAVERSAMIKKYQEVLEGIYNDQVYPDGSSCNYDNYGSISDNQFAVYDVDRDGQEELIIIFSTSSMAGMLESMYSYDAATDSVRLEFSEFPGAVYYDNGLALVGWSHNQGLAGDFWPYNVHQYNSQTDEYEAVFSVDAWERDCADIDFDGNPYPEDVDVDNAGIVFYIMPGDSYNMDHPMSMEDYNAWYNSIMGGAAELEVPFQYLTVENIAGIR